MSEDTVDTKDRIYRIKGPTVAYQHIDDEAILIHFELGCYYSTAKLGAEILSLLHQQVGVQTVVGTLAERHGSDLETVRGLVEPFIQELCTEELIVADPGGGVAPDQASATLGTGADEPRPLEPPVLHKYTDLQDMLLLDPIHDTDEAGWPVAAPEH